MHDNLFICYMYHRQKLLDVYVNYYYFFLIVVRNYFFGRFYIIKYRILRDENFRTVTGASTVDRKKHFNTVQEKINENNTKGKVDAEINSIVSYFFLT